MPKSVIHFTQNELGAIKDTFRELAPSTLQEQILWYSRHYNFIGLHAGLLNDPTLESTLANLPSNIVGARIYIEESDTKTRVLKLKPVKNSGVEMPATNPVSRIPSLQRTPELIAKQTQELIAKLPRQITELDLYIDEPLNDSFLTTFATLLPTLPQHIRKLKIGFISYNDESPNWLVRAAQGTNLSEVLAAVPPQITHLSLEGFILNQAVHPENIQSTLSRIPKTVHHLNLGSGYLMKGTLRGLLNTQEHRLPFLKAIPNTVSLLHIGQWSTYSETLSDKMVRDELAHIPESVTGFILHWNIERSSSTIFAKIHKKVHYIDLSNSLRPVHVDQEFHIYNLKRFLQGLPHHVTKISLSKLDLGYYNEKNKNKVFKKIVLKDIFKACSTEVTELDLSNNGLTQPTQEELEASFAFLPKKLNKINLSYNDFGSKTKEEWIGLIMALPKTVEDIIVDDEKSMALIAEIMPQVKRARALNNIPKDMPRTLLKMMAEYNLSPGYYKKTEKKIASSIEQDLIPLTQAYLAHLLEQLKAIDVELTFDNFENKCADNQKHLKQCHLIANKYHIVQDSLKMLQDNNSLPSARLLAFTEFLAEKHREEITVHRNPEWMQFLKNALIITAIICTGFIPGVLALLAYSHFTNKTSPSFFTKTEGEEFVEKTEDVFQKNILGKN